MLIGQGLFAYMRNSAAGACRVKHCLPAKTATVRYSDLFAVAARAVTGPPAASTPAPPTPESSTPPGLSLCLRCDRPVGGAVGRRLRAPLLQPGEPLLGGAHRPGDGEAQ